MGNDDNHILSPFPVNRVTEPDPTSPTGLRVDLPKKEDGTKLENLMIEQANLLDGFGIGSPICVRFDAPIDLSTLSDRSVYLVNVDSGKRVPLDIQHDRFPVTLCRPVQFYPNEPQHKSLLFPDSNKRSYYEEATNALILRPTAPLDPASKHVVLITRYLRGRDGNPIEPPTHKNPKLDEFNDYKTAMTLMGLAPIEVGFYWTFTTQSVTSELQCIREGLDGEGPLAWLPNKIPPRITSLLDLHHTLGDGNSYTLDSSTASLVLSALHQLTQFIKPVYAESEKDLGPFLSFTKGLKHVDHFVFGRFEAPSFVANEDGIFKINISEGSAEVEPASIPFVLSIPKPTQENGWAQAPYPVVILAHGITASRIMALPLADQFAARGLAVASFDFIGHGPIEPMYNIPRALKTLSGVLATAAKPVLAALGTLIGCPTSPLDSLPEMVDKIFSCGILAPLFSEGRSVDLDGDGFLDPAKGFFHPNFFRVRDNIRQSAVELLQFTRVLKGLGTDRNGNGKLDPEEGDINGDGTLDLGGPYVPYTFASMSLGGIIGGVYMAIEPSVETGVLNVSGGGLADMFFRTQILQEHIVDHVVADLMGLAIIGRREGDKIKFTFANDPIEKAFWEVPAAEVSEITITNINKESVYEAAANAKGEFSVVLATDKGDLLQILTTSSTGKTWSLMRASPQHGLGVQRGTTRAREMFMLLSWFMESADPVAYSHLWWKNPLPGYPKKKILMQLSAGDPVVPIASGLWLGRASGLISENRLQELVKLNVPAGDAVGVDELLPVESQKFHAIRFHVSGKHGYLIGGNAATPDQSIEMGFAVQNQMAAFLSSGGWQIQEDPIFGVALPDNNEPMTSKYIPPAQPVTEP